MLADHPKICLLLARAAMCGIYLTLEQGNSIIPSFLAARGPDHVSSFRHAACWMAASVLQMREQLAPQPCFLSDNRILLYNGELYEHDGQDLSNNPSDTEWLVERLQDASNDDESLLETLETLLSRCHAELALVLVTPRKLYFARDSFGRRSLLQRYENESFRAISSVATTGEWTEVLPGRVHVLDFATNTLQSRDPWVARYSLSASQLVLLDPVERLQSILLEAVRRRVAGHSTVSVLFSGGLDSAVVAALALQLVPVELVTVSFVDSQPAADALLAQEAFAELQALSDRAVVWNHRRVTWEEIQEYESHIRQLMQPKTTLMDLNISTALWFVGQAASYRIMLSGLGADELFGGYKRHRDHPEQMELDRERLWDRNLGRDDRVLSDSGHEVRFPFLDPAVVAFCDDTPRETYIRFDISDKYILRQVAGRLGLKVSRDATKRAIQFGTRVSHISDKRRFGSRRKAKGTHVT